MSKLIATYDFHYGIGNSEEIIRKGDWFKPRPTVHQDSKEARIQALRQGHGREPIKGETEPT